MAIVGGEGTEEDEKEFLEWVMGGRGRMGDDMVGDGEEEVIGWRWREQSQKKKKKKLRHTANRHSIEIAPQIIARNVSGFLDNGMVGALI